MNSDDDDDEITEVKIDPNQRMVDFRNRLIQSVVRLDRNKRLLNHTRSLIERLADEYGQDLQELFRELCEFLSEPICVKTLDLLANITYDKIPKESQSQFDEPSAKKPRYNLFEAILEELAILFDFYDENEKSHQLCIKMLLNIVIPYWIPHLLLCLRRYRPIATLIIDQIIDITRKDIMALIYDSLTQIIEIWLIKKQRDPQTTYDLDVYITYWTKSQNKLFFYNARCFPCLIRTLFCLSLNRTHSLTLIEELYNVQNANNMNVPLFSLTEAVRPKILGILLEFRHAIITEARFSERQHTVAKSLAILIELLDNDLFNKTASKFFLVLKSAVQLGESSIPAWEAFLVKLNHDGLLNLTPQILVAIMPLLQQDASRRILNNIFRRGELELGNPLTSKLHRILLVMSGNGFARLDEYLPAKLTQEQPAIVLKSCSALLITEGVETYPMILSKMISVLNNCEVTTTEAGPLARILLRCLNRVSRPELRNLFGKCLGCIGLFDLDASTSTKTFMNNQQQVVAAITSPSTHGTATENEADIPPANAEKSQAFIDNHLQFYADFIEGLTSRFCHCNDSDAVDKLIYCVQTNLENLFKLGGEIGQSVWQRLPEEVVREIEPIKNSTFTLIQKPDLRIAVNLPVIENAKSFEEWVKFWFYSAANQVADPMLRQMFHSVLQISANVSTDYMCALIPHLVLQAIIEQNEKSLLEFQSEATAVFRAVLATKVDWARIAAARMFSTLDLIERFQIHRMKTVSVNDQLASRAIKLLNAVLELPATTGGGSVPLSVLVADRCNCYFRALRWLEQFGIRRERLKQILEQKQFDHESSYFLERLYSSLDDTDGVLGTFSWIQNHTLPTPKEQILALKATGNYSDVLPLCQNVPGQEVELTKCLLRSNQPHLARATADFYLRNPSTTTEFDEKTRQKLADYQMEATCRLGDWEQLVTLQMEQFPKCQVLGQQVEKDQTEQQHEKKNHLKVVHTWGAQLASIFGNLKQFDQKAFDLGVTEARNSLMDSLQAITFEDSETYSQAYRYILKLRTLYEVEEVRKILFARGNKSLSVQNLLSKWEKQCEGSTSSSLNRCEPIISLRRELFKTVDLPNTSAALCRLLLQSARLSRRAGHLQTAWTYLVEARALRVNNPQPNICDVSVDMEEARYYFQKGEQTQAINVLRKAIDTNFPEMAQLLDQFCRSKQMGSRAPFESFERRKPFVEAQLLLAEFTEKAGASRMEDLNQLYQALEKYGERSETFYYRFAVFYDSYCESVKELTSEMVCTLLRLYRSVLEQGDRYLRHAMPRMLTVWLDLSQKCALTELATGSSFRTSIGGSINSATKSKQRGSIGLPNVMQTDPNAEIRTSFRVLDPYYFFTSFYQLISRIAHNDQTIYKTLKPILADLIVLYPHQAIWQSIAVARSDPVKQRLRVKRCAEVYDLAKKKCASSGGTVDLALMIRQYEYLATALMKIADYSKLAKSSRSKMSNHFPFLLEFFANGTMRPLETVAAEYSPLGGTKRQKASTKTLSIGGSGSGGIPPQLIIPFIDDVTFRHRPPQMPIVAAAKIAGNYLDDSQQSQIDVREPSCTTSAAKDSNSSQASNYNFQVVYIAGVEEQFEVLNSMAAPKKMALIGSDGKRYPLLCKGSDELCKDARFMDLNRMLNTLFSKEPETKRRQLSIRCYSVIPLQDKGGIIQWLPNLVPFTGALRPLMRELQVQMSSTELHKNIGDKALNLALEERLKRFREMVCPRFPVVMAQWQRRKFLDACAWYNARLRFTRTAATMSMVGFLLGLGDRHGDNILIDTRTCEVVHVDFNLLFDKGEDLRVPEIVPFRLTRNIIDGFGTTGVEGAFRIGCEAAMRVMRNEQRMLGTVLQAFAHDPLVEWSTTESRNQQARQYGGGTEVVQHSKEAIANIRLRLYGHIATAKFNKPNHCAVPMSVEGQVAKLIEMANDEANLVQMYVGWSSFI